jgi:hypothetical protein
MTSPSMTLLNVKFAKTDNMK